MKAGTGVVAEVIMKAQPKEGESLDDLEAFLVEKGYSIIERHDDGLVISKTREPVSYG